LRSENIVLKAKVNDLEEEVRIAFALKPPIAVQLHTLASSEAPKTTKGELPDPEKPKTTRGEGCGIWAKPTE